MPPKPWETRQRPVTQDISSMVRANSIQEDIKPLPPTAEKSPLAPSSPTTNTTGATGTSSSLLGSGSSYSGGLGSSYGSSYGGYGGYGGMSSMYGGGMFGMGGMGMYGSGMFGLGSAEGEQKGFLTNTLAALHSFGFLIYSLGQIGKTLEANIDGIHKFYESFKNLCSRLRTFTVESTAGFLRKIKQLFVRILTFIKEKVFMMNNRDRSKTNRFLNIMIRVLFLLFVVSLYPLLLKPKKA